MTPEATTPNFSPRKLKYLSKTQIVVNLSSEHVDKIALVEICR